MTTAQKIEEAILYAPMTWTELAERSGLSLPHLSKIRHGGIKQPDIVTVQKIAKALNMHYMRLLPD